MPDGCFRLMSVRRWGKAEDRRRFKSDRPDGRDASGVGETGRDCRMGRGNAGIPQGCGGEIPDSSPGLSEVSKPLKSSRTVSPCARRVRLPQQDVLRKQRYGSLLRGVQFLYE